MINHDILTSKPNHVPQVTIRQQIPGLPNKMPGMSISTLAIEGPRSTLN